MPQVGHPALEEQKPDFLKIIVEFPQSAMFGRCGLASLSKTTGNACVCQEVLEHFLRPTIDMFGYEDFTFQHNLAPTYNSKLNLSCTDL